MFQSIGPVEIIVLAVVVLLLFGGKKIPEFFKGLGEAVKEFKKSANDSDKSDSKDEKE